jgi:endogenous inhibitor of DNA gyrase (YacG/DUF329 family)
MDGRASKPRNNKKRLMLCPICKKPVEQPKQGERSCFPFCCERCKLIDLGRWLDGSYQIPVKDDDEAHDGESISSDEPDDRRER